MRHLRCLWVVFLCANLLATPIVHASDTPLEGRVGDGARGRILVLDRRKSMCLLCHSGPFPEERFQGTLAPSLTGIGGRMDKAGLRMRLVDSRSINPNSIMPAYFRAEGQTRVAPAFVGKTLLNAQEIEDVVAFLASLRE